MSDGPFEESDGWFAEEAARRLFGGELPGIADKLFVSRLQKDLEAELADTADLLRSTDRAMLPIRLRQDDILSLTSCQKFYVARAAEEFEYNVPKARPEVVHRTIRRYSRRGPGERGDPYDAVTQTIEGIIHSDDANPRLKDFLSGMSELDYNELVEDATRMVAQFLDGWPDLPETLTFRVRERYIRHFASRFVTVEATVPFRIGNAVRLGKERRSGSVLLNVRSGYEFELEERQSRFLWALLETLKFAIPPRRVATWYLDSNELFVDEVREEIVEAAAAKVVDAIRIAVDLRINDKEPEVRPGPRCTYCPVLPSCRDGELEVARRTG